MWLLLVVKSNGSDLFGQLDDWVLCRIYNKKGSIEKQNQASAAAAAAAANRKEVDMSEFEDKKPDITTTTGLDNTSAMPPNPAATGAVSDYVYFDTSDSVPKLHTDSSCSEHVVSPEFTCEVQSEPKWKPWENQNTIGFPYNYMDSTMDLSFNSQFQSNNQMSPLQDMFMYLQNQKPF